MTLWETILPSISGHVGCFLFGAVVNTAAVGVGGDGNIAVLETGDGCTIPSTNLCHWVILFKVITMASFLVMGVESGEMVSIGILEDGHMKVGA